jgi:hypothetical protein
MVMVRAVLMGDIKEQTTNKVKRVVCGMVNGGVGRRRDVKIVRAANAALSISDSHGILTM